MSVQTDQQATQLQQRLAADPALKARVAQLSAQLLADGQQIAHTHKPTPEQMQRQHDNSLELVKLTGVASPHNGNSNAGIGAGAPDGWMFNATGDLVKDHRLRHDILTVAAIVGGAALAGVAGAASAGGSAAAGGGSTAANEALTIGSMGKLAPAVASTTTGLGAFEKYANMGGQVLSGVEAGRAAGRNADAQAGRNDQDAIIAAILAGNAQRTSLGNEYDRNVKNAMRGNAISHIQDASFTPPAGVNMGTIHGGLHPSLLGGAEVGDPIHAAAMKYLLNPEQPRAVPTPTTPRASGTDTALDWLAPILTGIGNARKITGTPQPLPVPPR